MLTAVLPEAARAQQGDATPPFTVQDSMASATSGDSVVVGGVLIRLRGIAAPVPGQICRNRYGRSYDCFATARAVLANLIEGRTVACRVEYTSSRGENIGRCGVGIDLSAAMVVRGWAFAMHGLTPNYARVETYAQTHRRGMWSGHVEKPWQWEARQRRDQSR